MRPSVSQAQRAGRSQDTSRGVYSQTGSNITRHSVNPPPSRPSFAVTGPQHIPTRRHAPLRMSMPRAGQTLPRGTTLPTAEGRSPADNTGGETEPTTRRIMHSETLDRLSGVNRVRVGAARQSHNRTVTVPGRVNRGRRPQVATPEGDSSRRRQERPAPSPLTQTRQEPPPPPPPRPEPVEAPPERPQVRQEPQVERHAPAPRAAPAPTAPAAPAAPVAPPRTVPAPAPAAPPRVAPAPARPEPMRRRVATVGSMTDEMDPREMLNEMIRRVTLLSTVVNELGDDGTRNEMEFLLINLELMQMEQLQLEMALEISRREAEPRPEPPKKVEMKEHIVSRTECSEGNECAICLCEFRYHEKGVISLKCGHLFHKDCVAKWFEAHHTCPICRTDIDDG